MKKWKKNLIISISVAIVIGLIAVFLCFAIKYDDIHKSNLIAVICCIFGLFSSIVIGVLALFQNALYNSREYKKHKQKTENLLYCTYKIVEQNKTIIEIWDVEEDKVFKICNFETQYKIVFLKDWNNSIFSALDVDSEVFKKMVDYNEMICKINAHIDNYNKSISQRLIDNREAYKNYIKKEIQKLKTIQDDLLNYYKNILH